MLHLTLAKFLTICSFVLNSSLSNHFDESFYVGIITASDKRVGRGGGYWRYLSFTRIFYGPLNVTGGKTIAGQNAVTPASQ